MFFLRTAFDHLFQEEKELNDLYAKYAENGDEALLEKAGKVQTYLEENNFYDIDTEIEQVASGLGLADLAMTMMFQSYLVVSAQKLFWLNYFCKVQMSWY